MQTLLAKPRGFCAGVIRAIATVQQALERYGSPVYVLHEIVHNQKVVKDLEDSGAVFVQTLNQIPLGSVIVFSAHGVAAEVVRQAHYRGLQVIDATCPLVSKVHSEVAAHARAGRDVILIGHAGHAEVVGTLGRFQSDAGGEIHLVATVEEVWSLRIRRPDHIALVTQTTLSVDDTRKIVHALRQRFPSIVEPRHDDICYATQNRQNAVRQFAGRIDLLLVVGAHNSSNSNRLREVGEQMGIPSHLLQDASELDPQWLRPGARIGVTAGASTPEVLVDALLEKLANLGVRSVVEMDGKSESTTFALPSALARAS